MDEQALMDYVKETDPAISRALGVEWDAWHRGGDRLVKGHVRTALLAYGVLLSGELPQSAAGGGAELAPESLWIAAYWELTDCGAGECATAAPAPRSSACCSRLLCDAAQPAHPIRASCACAQLPCAQSSRRTS